MEGRQEVSKAEVKSNRRAVERATEKEIQKAARMIGGTLERHAKEAAPVDTGLLRNSITFALGGQPPETVSYRSNDKDKNGNPVEVISGTYTGNAPADDDHQTTVYVGTNVEYAPYQELGTEKMDARPFLRPAFENFREEIKQIIEKCLRSVR